MCLVILIETNGFLKLNFDPQYAQLALGSQINLLQIPKLVHWCITTHNTPFEGPIFEVHGVNEVT